MIMLMPKYGKSDFSDSITTTFKDTPDIIKKELN